MQDLLIFIFSVSGLSWIVTKSTILKPFREYITTKRIKYNFGVLVFIDKLLNCYGCFGFWSGIICYELQKYHCDIIYAFAGSMVSLLLIGLFNFLEKK